MSLIKHKVDNGQIMKYQKITLPAVLPPGSLTDWASGFIGQQKDSLKKIYIFKPGDDSRTIAETIVHIYTLTAIIYMAVYQREPEKKKSNPPMRKENRHFSILK